MDCAYFLTAAESDRQIATQTRHLFAVDTVLIRPGGQQGVSAMRAFSIVGLLLAGGVGDDSGLTAGDIARL